MYRSNSGATEGIPVLSDHTFYRYFNFVVLYLAQGIPEGILAFGIPAWMAMNGKSAGEIAGFAIAIAAPWSFKFIVAPMIDRYTYLPMGRRRPWVIFAQFGLIVSFAFMAFIPDPLNNLNLMMIGGFVVSFFGSMQDVATDGMAVDIIPAEQQARANGLMWGAKTIGISASLALGSWMLSVYDFKTTVLTLAMMVAMIIFVPIFLRERKGEKLTPWSNGKISPESAKLQPESWRVIFNSLFRVFRLKNSLLLAAILFVFQGSFKYIGTLLPVFSVKELGWTNVEYSNYYASAKLIGGIVGMITGGILIERFGKKRMLNFYFFSLILFIVMLVLCKSYWANRTVIYSYMILQNILYTVAAVGLFAMAMQCCWRKVSASQFTLYMTLANLGQIVFAAFIGPISNYFTWQFTLMFFGVFIALAWFILQLINVNKQMELISELERIEQEGKVIEFTTNAG